MTKGYRVELLGFPGLSREHAVAHLAEAFDLELEEAVTYVDAVPCIVRSDIDGDVAKEYARELLRARADVAIVDQGTGKRVVYQADALKERVDEALIEPRATPADLPLAVAAIPAGAASPSASVAKAAPAPPEAPVAPPEAEPKLDNVYCPRCGHRQPVSAQCSACGHTFASVQKKAAKPPAASPTQAESAGTEHGPDVDVFQSMRGRHLSEIKTVRPLGVPTRRTRDFSLELPSVRRRRRSVWVVVLLAVVLGIALLLMQPDEGLGPEDTLPEDIIPPPPGMRYRSL